MTTETITSTPLSPADVVDPVLDELLDAELIYDPVTRGGFINHVAMGLVAARRLGATDGELRDWYRRISRSDMLIDRGRPTWLRPETEDVAIRGLEIATAEQLPRVVDAPSSQLFHAPIRLELALDAGHPGQVANALHNWGAHAEAVGPRPEPTGVRSFADVVAELRTTHGSGEVDPADPHVQQVFASLDGGDALLDEVARHVLAAHATDDNFWTLHLVTGTRAVRAVAPLADDVTRAELAARTAQAVALLWLDVGTPLLSDGELDALRADAPDDWAAIGRSAVENRDAHTIKLTYAARREHEATGDPLYTWIAARQSGLI